MQSGGSRAASDSVEFLAIEGVLRGYLLFRVPDTRPCGGGSGKDFFICNVDMGNGLAGRQIGQLVTRRLWAVWKATVQHHVRSVDERPGVRNAVIASDIVQHAIVNSLHPDRHPICRIEKPIHSPRRRAMIQG